MSNQEEIHEHYAVSEVWCDGTADFYVTGSVLKFTYYSLQKIPGMQGFHRVAVLKVARPISSLEDSTARMRDALRQSRAMNGEGSELIIRPH